MENKVTLRIPTREPYAFVELVLEGATVEEAKEYYDNWIRTFNTVGLGVTLKEFNSFLDCYLSTGKPPENGLELWEVMSETQKICVNEVKKALIRINK